MFRPPGIRIDCLFYAELALAICIGTKIFKADQTRLVGSPASSNAQHAKVAHQPLRKVGAQRKPQTAIFSIASVLFAGDAADVLDNLLPSFAHVLESSVVLRRDETGMDKAKARSVFNPGKHHRDYSVQP